MVRSLVVSLHDVAPPFESEIRYQLERLHAMGVERCVLKVVPNWHGSYPITESPSLVALIHEELQRGSEIVLHGLEHHPSGPFLGAPWTRARGRLFAPDAAEFLSLDGEQAAQAIQRGFDLFARAGLPAPTTFCAPGWLLPRQSEDALAAAGLARIIRMFSLLDLPSGHRRWIPGFGYMGAGKGQEHGVEILNGIIRHTVLGQSTVAKAYLHPAQGNDSRGLERVLHRISVMTGHEGWKPVTYAEIGIA